MKRLDLNAIVKVKGGRRTVGHDIEGLDIVRPDK